MSTGGCDLTGYGPFQKTVLETDANAIKNASRIQCTIDDPQGISELLIFTGVAILDFRPPEEENLARGTLTILFNFDMVDPSNLIAGAASASLASVFQNVEGNTFTYAIDCVDIRVAFVGRNIGGQIIDVPVPSLVATLVVAGGGGNTGLSRVAYQANVQVRQPLLMLLGPAVSIGPPRFSQVFSTTSGDEWVYQVHLPAPAGPGGVNVQVRSSNPTYAQVVQSPITVQPGERSATSGPQTSKSFSAGPPINVQITAAADNLKASATLILNAVPQ